MGIRLNSILHFCLAVIIFLLTACKTTTSQTVTRLPSIDIKSQEPTLIPEDSLHPVFDGLERKRTVVKYYQTRSQNPAWFQNERFSIQADSMIYILQHVQYYGFPQGSYHFVELDSIWSDLTRDELIRREILLTDAFFSLSEDLRFGIQNTHSFNEDSLKFELLNSALTVGNISMILESQEPLFSGYTSLKEGLRLMLDSAKTGSFDSVSLQDNIRLISINLQRWRSENTDISGRYIFINIPSFNLDVVNNDSVMLSSKVIVGTPEKETPVLSSVVECFNIYPYWHVPRKISVEEYLPVIKTDSTFIITNNFDVLDRKRNILNPDSVEWNKFNMNYFPVMLRQREGPENSLGVIKFIFDNPYAVFLHDTNAKKLFKRRSRAFSHGCIRLEKSVELAHLLVTGTPGKESKYVNRYLKEKTQHWINLKNPIPIHIRYFTCEFRNNVFFRYDDVYHKDQKLYHKLWKSNFALDH